ncbi:MAG: hypothetical protein ABF904_14945 [Ethanoligenens sp.]
MKNLLRMIALEFAGIDNPDSELIQSRTAYNVDCEEQKFLDMLQKYVSDERAWDELNGAYYEASIASMAYAHTQGMKDGAKLITELLSVQTTPQRAADGGFER